MLRITAGQLKGRIIKPPKCAELRPSSDRLRESLFSILSSLAPSSFARVLDLYAGSGILGLEAISRGTTEVCFVERERELTRFIAQMCKQLAPGVLCEIKQTSVERFLRQKARETLDETFSLVLADPPYGRHPGAQLLIDLELSGVLSSSSVLAIEHPKEIAMPENDAKCARSLYTRRSFGQTMLSVYTYG